MVLIYPLVIVPFPMALPNPPPSPGVGARRRGPKNLPKLPLTAFSPPNTGVSDKFPLAPSPSVVHPTKLLDAHVCSRDTQLATWTQETSSMSSGVETIGVVLVLLESNEGEVKDTLSS